MTVTLPLTAPTGTVNVICEAFNIENATTEPFNLTEVAPEKLDPLIVTKVPGAAVEGLNPVIPGGGVATTLITLLVAEQPLFPEIETE